MMTPHLPRLGLALALCALAGAGLSQANAQDTSLARGDAVVTGFSGIKPLDVPVPDGANPLDYFFIDLQGPSAQILPLTALWSPPQGQLTPAPVKRQITAGQVGQVFGTTLDDGQGRDVPNVYLGATSAYGIQIVGADTDGDGHPDRLKTGAPGARFMAGQFGPEPEGTPGTIWRVDGVSGDVSPFARLPGNSGPGVGDVVFDKRTQQFFASDLDNGRIYRIAPDGTVVDSFDHGVSGRPANGMPPLADNGQVMDITSPSFDSQNPATWGYTQKERMVWGMAVHNGRLFYAVAGGLQVWSIGINTDGTFANDPRRELDATALPGDGPTTNIVFDGQGRMLLAQRGAPRGAYDYSAFAEPGKSSVVRYQRETPDDPATPGVWAPDADEYAIGMRPEFRNADGGIALGYRHDPETGAVVPGSCNATLWSTGSRLRPSANPDVVDDGSGEADVHGLQGNDASLVRPQNVPPTQAYYIDYDGLFGDGAKSGHMGDVAIWQPCEGFEIRGDLPPGFYPPGGIIVIDWPDPHGHPTNLRLRKRAIRDCVRWGAGWACRFGIRVRNTGPNPYFGPLRIEDHMPALPPGSLVGFSPMPPWGCGGGGGNYTCVRPPVFLPVGASRHLFVTVWVPNAAVRRGHCRIRNQARITFAPGGSVWNTDPSDDSDGATAVIPAPECRPRNNLVLRKISRGCSVINPNVANCDYRVTVSNAGPGTYHDTIRVMDEPLAGTTATFSGAPWACVAAGPGYQCTHPMANLAPGASVSFNARVRVPVDVARQHNCRVRNNARITFAPGGSPRNTNPGDDASFATGVIPAGFCAPQIAPAVQDCPPGYRYIDGACRRPPRVQPPERRCPRGTIGEWPDCRRIVPPRACPQGTVRRGGRCVTIDRECPRGTIGRWPNCRKPPVLQPCPSGTLRKGGRCVPIVKPCPRGTVRRGGRCVTIERACPRGTIGRWPNCRKPPVVQPCPRGTVRKGGRCVQVVVPRVCPKGTIGKWPNCRKVRTTPPLTHRPQINIR